MLYVGGASDITRVVNDPVISCWFRGYVGDVGEEESEENSDRGEKEYKEKGDEFGRASIYI